MMYANKKKMETIKAISNAFMCLGKTEICLKGNVTNMGSDRMAISANFQDVFSAIENWLMNL